MSPDAVITAVGVAAALAATIGLALGWAASRLAPDDGTLVAQIDALLPQTQCGQCQFPGCRPYAAAIAHAQRTSTAAHLGAMTRRAPSPPCSIDRHGQ